MKNVSKLGVCAVVALAWALWSSLGDFGNEAQARGGLAESTATKLEIVADSIKTNSPATSLPIQDGSGAGPVVLTVSEAQAAIEDLVAEQESRALDPDLMLTPELTEEIYDYYRDSLQDLQGWLEIIGVDTQQTQNVYGERLPIFDFSLPTHQEFLANEAAHLMLLTEGQAATGAQYLSLFDPTQTNMVEGPNVRLFLIKLMSILGVSPGAQKGFNGAVDEVLGKLPKALAKAIDKGEFKRASRIVKLIVRKLVSKTFAKALKRHVGRQLAGKIIAKIGSKFVPFLGWTLFIGGLIVEVVNQLRD